MQYILLVRLTPEGLDATLENPRAPLEAERGVSIAEVKALGIYAVLGAVRLHGDHRRARQRRGGALVDCVRCEDPGRGHDHASGTDLAPGRTRGFGGTGGGSGAAAGTVGELIRLQQ